MAGWNADELRRFGQVDELEIAAARRDGTLRAPRPIWAVRAGDDLYVRAAYVPGSGWHRAARTSGRARISAAGLERDVAVEEAGGAVLDLVDAAYREKYSTHYAGIVDSISDEEHRSTTLRLHPYEEA
jgi:hypothetical protein